MWTEYKLAPITSFRYILDVLHEAHEKKQLIVIYGSTGFGKSIVFNHYQKNTHNCFYVKIKPAESAKSFFYRFIDLVNNREYVMDNYKNSVSLNWMIEQSSYDYLLNKNNPIVLFDEAGNFTKNSQSYLRQVWDNIKGESAMVISGPDRYKLNLKKWNLDLSSGIPEFVSRIDNSYELPIPSLEDIDLICRTNEIDDRKVVKYIFKNSHNLRNVRNYVIAHHNDNLDMNKDAG